MSVMITRTCLPSTKAKYSAAVSAKRGVSSRCVDESLARLRKSAVRSSAPLCSRLLRKNSVKGTSGYMSPEQIRGEPLDPRSDIFALGVVLHECLTGMRLFHGKNAEDGMLAALREEAQPPSRLSPEVTPALDAVTLKALARDRDHRYGTALELARAIEKACPGSLWLAEQSGDLVQRFYNERRQQTRDLVENAQNGHEPTGELKIDMVLAAVANRPHSPGRTTSLVPGVSPTPITGVLPVGPRRVTAVTTPVAVLKRDSKPPPSVVPEAKQQNLESKEPEDFDDDSADSGAKTIPAASLPPEMMAEIRANRERMEALTDAHTASIRNPVTQPLSIGGHSNVVLEPVLNRSGFSEGSIGATETSNANDPFIELLESERGIKTASDRPFANTGAQTSLDGGAHDKEPPTHSGTSDSPRDVRLVIVRTGVLVIVILGGLLLTLNLPPFSEESDGPWPATKLAGALEDTALKMRAPVRSDAKPVPSDAKPVRSDVKPVPSDAKPTEMAEPKAKVAEQIAVEPKRPSDPVPTIVVKKPDPKPIRKPVRETVRRRSTSPQKAQEPTVLGSISLVVEPPVHVFFGGKDLGITPLKVTLPVGKQTVKLVPSEGPSKLVSVDVKESGGAARFDLEDL